MEILLDTNAVIKTLRGEIPPHIEKLINNPNNGIYYSSVSLWEIDIKHNKHPKAMPYSSTDIFSILWYDTDFIMLTLKAEYINLLSSISGKDIHNDPFDHMLLATAKEEEMTFVTTDRVLKEYEDENLSVIVF